MPLVRLFLLLFSAACLIFMIIGLIKPWIMLWWEDIQNRKKILIVYGSLSIVFFLVYEILGWVS